MESYNFLAKYLPSNQSTHYSGHSKSKEVLTCTFVVLLLAIFIQKSAKSVKKEKRKAVLGKPDTFNAFSTLKGPLTVPFIGFPFELLFNSDIISLSLQWVRKYGSCYKMKIFNSDYVILNSPSYVQAILTSNDHGHFRKADLEERLWPEGVHSLLSFTGEEWRARRKMLNRSFTYKSLRKYNQCFNRHSGRLVDALMELYNDGKVHNITKLIKSCILRQSSETLMGVDLAEVEGGKIFIECFEIFMDLTFQRVYSPWQMIPWIFSLQCGKRYNHALHQVGQVTEKIIHQFQETRKVYCEVDSINELAPCLNKFSQDGNHENDKSDCVIEVMLRNGCKKMDIVHEVAVMLAVAHDTTSLSVEFALFLLAVNQNHQKNCQEEIDRIFDDRTKYKDDYLEYAALAEMKYLERCLLEAQRMYPLASLMRKLETPLKLRDDLVIPAGVSAAYISHSLHLNPEIFPNPDQFNPDRFLPEESKKRHPYAYVPFSGGPRICIGMKLAIIELKIVIAKILRNFDVLTPDKQEDLKLDYRGLPKPKKPIRFLLKRRKLVEHIKSYCN